MFLRNHLLTYRMEQIACIKRGLFYGSISNTPAVLAAPVLSRTLASFVHRIRQQPPTQPLTYRMKYIAYIKSRAFPAPSRTRIMSHGKTAVLAASPVANSDACRHLFLQTHKITIHHSRFGWSRSRTSSSAEEARARARRPTAVLAAWGRGPTSPRRTPTRPRCACAPFTCWLGRFRVCMLMHFVCLWRFCACAMF